MLKSSAAERRKKNAAAAADVKASAAPAASAPARVDEENTSSLYLWLSSFYVCVLQKKHEQIPLQNIFFRIHTILEELIKSFGSDQVANDRNSAYLNALITIILQHYKEILLELQLESDALYFVMYLMMAKNMMAEENSMVHLYQFLKTTVHESVDSVDKTSGTLLDAVRTQGDNRRKLIAKSDQDYKKLMAIISGVYSYRQQDNRDPNKSAEVKKGTSDSSKQMPSMGKVFQELEINPYDEKQLSQIKDKTTQTKLIIHHETIYKNFNDVKKEGKNRLAQTKMRVRFYEGSVVAELMETDFEGIIDQAHYTVTSLAARECRQWLQSQDAASAMSERDIIAHKEKTVCHLCTMLYHANIISFEEYFVLEMLVKPNIWVPEEGELATLNLETEIGTQLLKFFNDFLALRQIILNSPILYQFNFSKISYVTLMELAKFFLDTPVSSLQSIPDVLCDKLLLVLEQKTDDQFIFEMLKTVLEFLQKITSAPKSDMTVAEQFVGEYKQMQGDFLKQQKVRLELNQEKVSRAEKILLHDLMSLLFMNCTESMVAFLFDHYAAHFNVEKKEDACWLIPKTKLATRQKTQVENYAMPRHIYDLLWMVSKGKRMGVGNYCEALTYGWVMSRVMMVQTKQQRYHQLYDRLVKLTFMRCEAGAQNEAVDKETSLFVAEIDGLLIRSGLNYSPIVSRDEKKFTLRMQITKSAVAQSKLNEEKPSQLVAFIREKYPQLITYARRQQGTENIVCYLPSAFTDNACKAIENSFAPLGGRVHIDRSCNKIVLLNTDTQLDDFKSIGFVPTKKEEKGEESKDQTTIVVLTRLHQVFKSAQPKSVKPKSYLDFLVKWYEASLRVCDIDKRHEILMAIYLQAVQLKLKNNADYKQFHDKAKTLADANPLRTLGQDTQKSRDINNIINSDEKSLTTVVISNHPNRFILPVGHFEDTSFVVPGKHRPGL